MIWALERPSEPQRASRQATHQHKQSKLCRFWHHIHRRRRCGCRRCSCRRCSQDPLGCCRRCCWYAHPAPPKALLQEPMKTLDKPSPALETLRLHLSLPEERRLRSSPDFRRCPHPRVRALLAGSNPGPGSASAGRPESTQGSPGGSSGVFMAVSVGSPFAGGSFGVLDKRLPQRERATFFPSVTTASPLQTRCLFFDQ